MKVKIYALTLLFVFALCGIPAKANINPTTTNFVQDDRCTVSDPTGTFLNVRSKPNGRKIVRRLKNGTKVFVVYEMGDEQDRPWSKISLSNKGNAPIIGWVLREYLECP
jgi:uncharacterized protein YgiM (DUF1202 family)